MAEQRGWWELKITGARDLSEADREHIGELIADGFTEGEIVADGPQEDEPGQAHFPGPSTCVLPPPVRDKTLPLQEVTCAVEGCGCRYILITDHSGSFWENTVEFERELARHQLHDVPDALIPFRPRKVHVPGPDTCALPPPVRTQNLQHATCALESCGHQYILISAPPEAGGTYWTSRFEWERAVARTQAYFRAIPPTGKIRP